MTGESSFTILPYSNAPTGFDRLAPQCAPFDAVADFKVLVPQYQDQWVLALGCESLIREEAQELGFKKGPSIVRLTQKVPKHQPFT